MRPVILSIILACAYAGEAPKLPADVQATIDKNDRAVTAVQAKADGEIYKLRQTLIAALTKAQEAATKKGDLDTAMAIKAKIESIKLPSLIDDQPRIDPSKLRSYTAKVWDQLPGTVFTIATAESAPLVIEDGEVAIIVPHPTDSWSAGTGFAMTDYRGGKTVYGNNPYMALLVVLTKDGVNAPMVPNPTEPIIGPARFVLRPNDGVLTDNVGSIRVKVIMQPRQ